jgi:hypothetical protein
MGRSCCPCGLGDDLVSLVRRDCRLGQRVSAEAVRLYVGAAAPDVGASAVVCVRFALCSMGCGWPRRAVLRLQREQEDVGMAVPEGGVGGLLGAAELVDVGTAVPKPWQC